MDLVGVGVTVGERLLREAMGGEEDGGMPALVRGQLGQDGGGPGGQQLSQTRSPVPRPDAHEFGGWISSGHGLGGPPEVLAGPERRLVGGQHHADYPAHLLGVESRDTVLDPRGGVFGAVADHELAGG